MPNNINLSIVIPCFNEEKNIPIMLNNFKGLLENKPSVELILVDNGSLDNTGKVIDKEITENNYRFIRKVTVKKNIGYGFGIISGLKESRGEVLSWTHADLQTDPKDVLKAYDLYLENSKDINKVFIKGYRKKRKFFEGLFSIGMEFLASLILGTYLSEANAQPKLFHKVFLDLIKNPPDDFSLDLYTLYIAKRNNYKIIPLPVYFKGRVHGEAKGGSGSNFTTKCKLIIRTLKYICELKVRILKGGI